MDEIGEFPAPWHDALAGLIAILLALVPIEQILTLKVLLRVDSRRKRLIPYLINLVVANMIFVFFNFPLSVASNLSRRYVSGKPVCIFLGYIMSASVLVTFATFAACTVIVYNATNELTTTPQPAKRRKDIIIILEIWFLAFAILSPMVGFWRRETFQPGTSGCTPMRTLQTAGDIAYFVILTVVAFSTPMGISFVYSIKIYLFFAQIKPFQMSFRQQQKYREYKNISKMIIASVMVFVICWTPFAIVGLVSVFGYSPSPELRAIPYLLSKSSVFYNPIIYANFNAKFRAAVVSLFRCGSCRKTQISDSYPNHAESHHVNLPRKMVPRSPVVGFRDTRHVDINEEQSVSYDSLFGVPRYREKLITVASGLKIYSLEEQP